MAEDWNLSQELLDLDEIVGSISSGEGKTDSVRDNRELQALVKAANKISYSMRNYQGAIEEHARFSDRSVTNKPEFVHDMVSYAHELAMGGLRKQIILLNLVKYIQDMTLSKSEAKGFVKNMTDYANRLETGMNESINELAQIGVAVSSLSHCVKNIVNNLKAGSFVLEKGLKKEDYGMVTKGWGMLGKNINRMSDLALDMLTYSKKREPDYEDIDLNKLLEEVYDFSMEKAKSQGTELVKELDPAIGIVRLEQKGIYRSVLNLVSNSIDACEERENSMVWVRSVRLGEGSLRIDVSDNGSGMTDETKEKLFTSFFSTKGSKGTGLGLPTTFKIIKEHGGTIDVASELGKGTTFSINLPV